MPKITSQTSVHAKKRKVYRHPSGKERQVYRIGLTCPRCESDAWWQVGQVSNVYDCANCGGHDMDQVYTLEYLKGFHAGHKSGLAAGLMLAERAVTPDPVWFAPIKKARR